MLTAALHRRPVPRNSGVSFLLAALLLLGVSPRTPAETEFPSPDPSPRSFLDRNGELPAQEGGKLRLTADLGAVRIFSLAPGEAPVVRYSVHIETNADGPQAREILARYSLKAESTPEGVRIEGALPRTNRRDGSSSSQFWVRFEVYVPRNFSVEVVTGGGDIETQDLGGTARLVTGGGSIRCGRITPSAAVASSGKPAAYLETQGGHISSGGVNGDLIASTGGGHIQVAEITGNATLHSGGGHIRAARIDGQADLSTGGGNITVGRADSTVSASTKGGQIDFGETRGSVHASTGGGGIRFASASGPLRIETSGGSICLTRIAGSVTASTSNGAITAFLNPETSSPGGSVQLAGDSLLSSHSGDLLVYLPRNLAANIEAVVAHGGAGHIQADPSLPLTRVSEGSEGSPLRATASLNGGGAVLRLRTDAGTIHLQYLDSDVALREALLREQTQRIAERMREVRAEMAARMAGLQPPPAPPDFAPVAPPAPALVPASDQKNASEAGAWSAFWMELEEKIRGGIGADPAELEKRALFTPPPVYPPLAKKNGIQGTVRLSIRVDKKGRTEVLKILEGEPILAEAAIAAVKQWRYQPPSLNGTPVSMISEVSFNFVLH